LLGIDVAPDIRTVKKIPGKAVTFAPEIHMGD
jgi:hypothetical protein